MKIKFQDILALVTSFVDPNKGEEPESIDSIGAYIKQYDVVYVKKLSDELTKNIFRPPRMHPYAEHEVDDERVSQILSARWDYLRKIGRYHFDENNPTDRYCLAVSELIYKHHNQEFQEEKSKYSLAAPTLKYRHDELNCVDLNELRPCEFIITDDGSFIHLESMIKQWVHSDQYPNTEIKHSMRMIEKSEMNTLDPRSPLTAFEKSYVLSINPHLQELYQISTKKIKTKNAEGMLLELYSGLYTSSVKRKDVESDDQISEYESGKDIATVAQKFIAHYKENKQEYALQFNTDRIDDVVSKLQAPALEIEHKINHIAQLSVVRRFNVGKDRSEIYNSLCDSIKKILKSKSEENKSLRQQVQRLVKLILNLDEVKQYFNERVRNPINDLIKRKDNTINELNESSRHASGAISDLEDEKARLINQKLALERLIEKTIEEMILIGFIYHINHESHRLSSEISDSLFDYPMLSELVQQYEKANMIVHNKTSRLNNFDRLDHIAFLMKVPFNFLPHVSDFDDHIAEMAEDIREMFHEKSMSILHTLYIKKATSYCVSLLANKVQAILDGKRQDEIAIAIENSLKTAAIEACSRPRSFAIDRLTIAENDSNQKSELNHDKPNDGSDMSMALHFFFFLQMVGKLEEGIVGPRLREIERTIFKNKAPPVRISDMLRLYSVMYSPVPIDKIQSKPVHCKANAGSHDMKSSLYGINSVSNENLKVMTSSVLLFEVELVYLNRYRSTCLEIQESLQLVMNAIRTNKECIKTSSPREIFDLIRTLSPSQINLYDKNMGQYFQSLVKLIMEINVFSSKSLKRFIDYMFLVVAETSPVASDDDAGFSKRFVYLGTVLDVITGRVISLITQSNPKATLTVRMFTQLSLIGNRLNHLLNLNITNLMDLVRIEPGSKSYHIESDCLIDYRQPNINHYMDTFDDIVKFYGLYRFSHEDQECRFLKKPRAYWEGVIKIMFALFEIYKQSPVPSSHTQKQESPKSLLDLVNHEGICSALIEKSYDYLDALRIAGSNYSKAVLVIEDLCKQLVSRFISIGPSFNIKVKMNTLIQLLRPIISSKKIISENHLFLSFSDRIGLYETSQDLFDQSLSELIYQTPVDMLGRLLVIVAQSKCFTSMFSPLDPRLSEIHIFISQAESNFFFMQDDRHTLFLSGQDHRFSLFLSGLHWYLEAMVILAPVISSYQSRFLSTVSRVLDESKVYRDFLVSFDADMKSYACDDNKTYLQHAPLMQYVMLLLVKLHKQICAKLDATVPEDSLQELFGLLARLLLNLLTIYERLIHFDLSYAHSPELDNIILSKKYGIGIADVNRALTDGSFYDVSKTTVEKLVACLVHFIMSKPLSLDTIECFIRQTHYIRSGDLFFPVRESLYRRTLYAIPDKVNSDGLLHQAPIDYQAIFKMIGLLDNTNFSALASVLVIHQHVQSAPCERVDLLRALDEGNYLLRWFNKNPLRVEAVRHSETAVTKKITFTCSTKDSFDMTHSYNNVSFFYRHPLAFLLVISTTQYLAQNQENFKSLFNARASLSGMKKALSAQLSILVLSGTLSYHDLSIVMQDELKRVTEESLVKRYVRQFLYGSKRSQPRSRASIFHEVANDRGYSTFFRDISSEDIQKIVRKQ